jgi:NADH dehydrogenase
MGTKVTGVDANGVDVTTAEGDDRILARTVVWAAGVQASPLAALLGEATGAEVDRAGGSPCSPISVSRATPRSLQWAT